jgi:hypothetical protein
MVPIVSILRRLVHIYRATRRHDAEYYNIEVMYSGDFVLWKWLPLLIKSLSVSGESGYQRTAGGPHRGRQMDVGTEILTAAMNMSSGL